MERKVLFQSIFSVSAILLLVFPGSSATDVTEGSTCNLPNNAGQSKCTFFTKCPSLSGVQRRSLYGLAADDQNYMTSFFCNSTKPLFCCPDFAVKTTLTTTTPEPVDLPALGIASRQIQSSKEYPVNAKPVNLEKILVHRNFDLINRTCGTSSETRIVGGNATKAGEYPWMALLQYKIEGVPTFKCGGSLISEYYVLTAAHCLNKNLMGVRLGEHDISTVQDWKRGAKMPFTVQDIEIESYVAYSKYDRYRKLNDIGLIRLKSPANLEKPNIGTICLPVEEDNQFENLDDDDDEPKENLFIAGWGYTRTRTMSNVMMKARVSFIEEDACARRLGKEEVEQSWICAGRETKVDSCHGDSGKHHSATLDILFHFMKFTGGPLFTPGMVHSRVKFIQYGVIASGVACENPEENYPGVYTNVGYYIDWILDHMH